MEVRGPVSIFEGRAEAAHLLSGADGLAWGEASERSAIEVAVKRDDAIVGEQDGGAVIAFMSVVGHRMHRAIQWRENGRAGGCPEIETEMDAAVIAFAIGEIGAAAIEGPVLRIATDSVGSGERVQQSLHLVQVCFGQRNGGDI